MKKFLTILVVAMMLCLTSCESSQEDKEYITSVSQLDNADIAAWTGTWYEHVTLERIPNANIHSLDFLSDMFVSLQDGKVKAVSYGKVLYPNLKKEFPDLTYVQDFEAPVKYAVMFAKNSYGEQLRDEFNEFLARIEADGRKDQFIKEWIGVDEHAYVGLNEWDTSNGHLEVQCGSSTPPFIYIYNNEISGYDLALFSEFAKEKKMSVHYQVNDFASLPVALNAGMCDACICGFDVTPEREEAVNFSTPIYENVVVLYTLGDPNDIPEYTSLQELDGLRAGCVTGAIDEWILGMNYPNCEINAFTTHADELLALKNNKIDFFEINRTQAEAMQRDDSSIYILDVPVYVQKIGFYSQKNDERTTKILDELNTFIENNKDYIKECTAKWEADSDAEAEEYELTGENGVLKYAANASAVPYSFIRNEELVGIDLDILNKFCYEQGYTLESSNYDFSGIIEAASSGRADIGGSGMCITDERSEAVNFSVPYNTEDSVIVVRKGQVKESFLDSLYASFEKNLIREDRWKLILSGMLCTLTISVLSILFGSILGFIFYMLCRKRNTLLDKFLGHLASLIDGLPTVVILMILYYIIFVKTSLSGEAVSIACFSLSFSLQVYSMLKVAVKSIDIGQEEAAFSIGFDDMQTFFEIVLPQALTQFIPNYKNAMIALLKGTAIVGYIAVQDLTKMSDLIRARTFEAFFPLISTALIYFLLGKLLSLVFKAIEDKMEPQRRSKEKILRKYSK